MQISVYHSVSLQENKSWNAFFNLETASVDISLDFAEFVVRNTAMASRKMNAIKKAHSKHPASVMSCNKYLQHRFTDKICLILKKRSELFHQ